MDIKRIIKDLGGPSRVGEMVGGITSQAVSQWRSIPARHCRVLASQSGGRYSVHDLRPDIFGPSPSSDEAA